MSYIKKKENNFQKNKIKEKEKLKEINLMSEPEPSKKNFICQLCRSRFDNYKEHILSETHCKNIKKHKNTFNKLTITFKRIVKSHSCDKNNFVYSTPKKELNLKEVKSKENSYTKSLSSLLTNESNNLIEFSPEDFKKEKKYNLRIKKVPRLERIITIIFIISLHQLKIPMLNSSNKKKKLIHHSNKYYRLPRAISKIFLMKKSGNLINQRLN
jgi:hypothetical protein